MTAACRRDLCRVFSSPPLDVGDAWPDEDTDDGRPEPQDIDDDGALELDDEYWDALLPDDDYEPLPEPGDFWSDQDAA